MKREQLDIGRIYISSAQHNLGTPFYVKSIEDGEVYYSNPHGKALHCSIDNFLKMFLPW